MTSELDLEGSATVRRKVDKEGPSLTETENLVQFIQKKREVRLEK